MAITRRYVARTVLGAAAAVGVLAGAAGEARAGDGAAIGVATTLGVMALADLSFAVYDLKAAADNHLPRDGFVIAETILTVPQTLLFNAALLGFATSKGFESDLATFLGTIPTAGVTALTIHGIWALVEETAAPDTLAGVSVLVGTNFSLSMSALGRGFTGRLHSRPVGVMEMVLSAPGVGVSIYESTIERPQRELWLGLAAWSGVLFVHGAISAFRGMDKDREPEPPSPPPEEAPKLQRAARFFKPASFTLGPSMLSDGVTRMPGVVAAGTF